MEQRRRLLFTVALLAAVPHSDTFEVTSPQSVVGMVNQDAILPCHVSSIKPLDNIEVQWKKITDGDLEDIHTQGKLGDKQAPKYLERTSLPRDGFATGNVSLTLRNVQPADEGTYSCIVTSGDWSANTTIDLNVTGVREVFLELLGPKGQGLELACRTEGWFPKPTVRWVTRDGQELSADTTMQQDSSHLFSVLSRVTVTRGEGQEVTCQVLHPILWTEKTTLRLSSAAFPSQSPWFPSFWTVFTLLLITLAVGAVRIFRGCRTSTMDADSYVNAALDTFKEELAGCGGAPRPVQYTVSTLPRHPTPITYEKYRRETEIYIVGQMGWL